MLTLSALGATAQVVPPPGIPWHPVPWIDTVPRESHDKPCTVDSLEVTAKVKGLFSRVDTVITLRNPNGRVISCPLQFPLPDSGTVCGYALEINGQMVDGVVVPKEKARVAFETEQRKGVDPGLVEAVKGNVYRTRVYPVPANGTRKVKVSYVAPLLVSGEGAALSLPMPDVTLAKRSVTIEVADTVQTAPVLAGLGDRRFEQAERVWRVSSTETNLAVRSDILVAMPQLPETIASVETTEDGTAWFCASVRTPAAKQPAATDAPAPTVLWDASGSRAGDHAKELQIVRALGAKQVIVFRNRAEPVRTFKTTDELVAFLEKLVYDGGTDFRALDATLAPLDVPAVLFTDGVDTLSGAPMEFHVKQRVSAIVSGAERDFEAVRQACGGQVYDLLRVDPATVRATIRDGLPCVTGVDGSGIADVQGIGSDASGRATVMGRLAAETAELVIRSQSGGTERKSAAIRLAKKDAVRGETLAAAWAAARVTRLAPRADDNEEELLALGRRFGVVSPATSLLVLETLSQWLQYDIEPPPTLPELRQRWAEARKGRMNNLTDAAKAERHLDTVVRMWKERKEWWKRDYSKDPFVDPREKAREERSGGRGFLGRMFSAPVAAAQRRGSVNASMAAEREAFEDRAAAPAPMMAARATAGAPAPAAPRAKKSGGEPSATVLAASIAVKPWSPDVPYLAKLQGQTKDAARDAYLAQRAEYATTPAFFLDCAGWFFRSGDPEMGERVISNLSEMKLEDAALLRVMAWRLREAGVFELAITTLRRVMKLRGEDAQSYRDLALVLDEAGRWAFAAGDKAKAKALLEGASTLYHKLVKTPWRRHPESISIFAVEEYNALIAWSEAQDWGKAGKPKLEKLDERLQGVLDCDMRVVMSWDADETDIDLHVTEPSGEEAFYGRHLTRKGGFVSKDITDGYGPEEYMIRKAEKGGYTVRAHYFASHQQTVFGPATVTATIFTDWVRPNQKSQTLSIRLDKAKKMLELGIVGYGVDAKSLAENPGAAAKPQLAKGMTKQAVEDAFGKPKSATETEWVYARDGGRTWKLRFKDGKLSRAEEILPGGDVTILVQ